MIQVIQTLKGEVFLLDLFHYFLREFPELAQRTHGLPPSQEGRRPELHRQQPLRAITPRPFPSSQAPPKGPSLSQLSPSSSPTSRVRAGEKHTPSPPYRPSAWGPSFAVTSSQLSGPLHALINHLAEVQGLVCKLRPTPVQDNFKDGTHQPASRLGKEKAFPLLRPHHPRP